MSEPSNLGDLVDRSGDPDKPLVISVGLDGSETIVTRAALDAMADAFARGLPRDGIARGERIAILPAAIAWMNRRRDQQATRQRALIAGPFSASLSNPRASWLFRQPGSDRAGRDR